MGRPINKLTVREVDSESRVGTHCDGNGLYLQIAKGGTKAWVFKYEVNGNRHAMGLGSVTTVSLKKAREMAQAARLRVIEGYDPIAERDARRGAIAADKAKAMTFAECAEDYIKTHRSSWKSTKHGAQWSATLKQHAKAINKLQVGAVDIALVVKVLKPIWTETPETARRVRSRIEMVLERAAALKLRTGDNPARLTGQLKHLLGPQPKNAGHHEAMPYQQLPAFVVRLREREGISARALEWTILTECRTGDTTGAKWSEINEAERTWTVPAARLKGKLGTRKADHVVPLSARALAILRDLPRDGEFVFPGGKAGQPISNMAMAELLKGMGDDGTVHGMRSTFRTWGAAETHYPHEMLELALAHVVGTKVERAYQHSDMLEKRRALMTDWAMHCGGVAGDNVISLKASA